MSEADEKRVVVITGASSGFGRGVAIELSKQGALVVLAARHEKELQDVARECEAVGGYARVQVTDVSNQADVERLAQVTRDTFGRIDVWINNAGVAAIGRFEQVPLADHVQVIETDLLGTVYGSYAAMQQFHKQGHGTLINLSSGLGKIAAPYYASYSAAKFGVLGLCGALRQELRENNIDDIHVCAVLPMAMDTPFFAHASNYTGRESVPIPPLYDPHDVVDVIVGLVARPQDEVVVGGVGKVALAAHAIAPGLVENIMGRQTHNAQITNAAPAPKTEGNVQEPTSDDTMVEAGRLQE